MPVSAPDGTPRCLYMLCRNNGYDVADPDPMRSNEPDLSPPDPPDSNYDHNTQVLCYIYVADDAVSGDGSDHRHFMPTPGVSLISQQLTGDTHFHGSWIKQDGGQKWSTEHINGKAAHDHEVDIQYLVNSLGEEGYVMRPKWCLTLSKCNAWTHFHWDANGGGRTIPLAERPYISGDDADTSTWVFEQKADNTAWDGAYYTQMNNYFLSRFGLVIPVDDGNGDSGVNNDRRLISWFNNMNKYQWSDESRFG